MSIGYTGINRLKEIFAYIKDLIESKITTVNDTITTKEGKVFYCTCSTAAATATKVVTVDANSNFTLKAGAIIVVKFTNSNTASSVKLNVAGTGAKSIWYNTATYTSTSAVICGTAKRHIAYVYDGTYWVWIGMSYYYSYSNPALGQGYGTCSTEKATLEKAVTLGSYALTNGGIVSIKFDNDVSANSTLNINTKGAKSIIYHGVALTDGIIKSGDIATFIYSSSLGNYILIAIDSNIESDAPLFFMSSETLISTNWVETSDNGASLEYTISPSVEITESDKITISLDETKEISSDIITACQKLNVSLIKYLSSDSKIHIYAYGSNQGVDVPINIEIRRIGD